MIAQLEKTQKALTSGLEDLAMLQQLPETSTQTSKLPVDYKPAMMKKSAKLQSNLDGGFSSDEMQTLAKYNLIAPSDVFKAVKDKQLDWGDYNKKISKILKEIGSEKGGLSKPKMKEKNVEKIEQLTNKIETIQKYKKRISVIPEGLKTVGSGVKYKQPKRNAYKIQDGSYGGLVIDVPRLFNDMKLNVF